MCQNTTTLEDWEEFKVGVILDTDTSLGKMGLISISMAISDLYALSTPTSHKRWLVLHIRDSNRDVVGAASAGIHLSQSLPSHYGCIILTTHLRDATQAYKSKALELQKQLRHLQSQFDLLEGQASTLIQGRRARVGATSVVNGHLAAIDDKLSARNLEGRCLSLIQAASEVHEQGAVDDRDTFLHGVSDLLRIHSNAQGILPTYVSAPSIIQQFSSLRSNLQSLQYDLKKSLPEDRNRCIYDLCTLIQSLQKLLFASSTTAQQILTT